MKILVCVSDYYGNKGLYYSFAHNRNLIYKQNGLDVDVLNFSAKEDYVVENISVFSCKNISAILDKTKYDCLICHAPNIRNHYQFLKRYDSHFPKIVFFFHGHEVLKIAEVYPKPYFFLKKSNFFIKIGQKVYDSIKLIIWNRSYQALAYKADFVFVSNWMKNQFFYYTKIDKLFLEDRCHIIPNSVGEVFEQNRYDSSELKEFDFITIRGNLDGSKYAVDIVNELAKNNLNLKFLVIGKGSFFKHFSKSPNITWLNQTLSHSEIIKYLNKTRCALMPTRADAQGLMMCEMAQFGIPLITSDVDVCHEVCEHFKNVALIENTNTSLQLAPLLSGLLSKMTNVNDMFYLNENTVKKEINLIVGGR